MGDRANVVIEDDGKEIFFYTHWRGSELPTILQTALAKKWRWKDSSYLARIIFCEMVKGDEQEETGFGISPTVGDNEYAYLRVNSDKQTVTVDYTPVRKYQPYTNRTFTFAKFAALTSPSWLDLLLPEERKAAEADD